MNQKTSSKALEIMDLARLLIANGGYNGFSYADISKTLGVTNASIHYHFSAKADLVKAVVLQYRENGRETLARVLAENDDPVALLRMFVDHWQRCLREGPLPFCICVMLASEMALLPDYVADEVQGHFDDLSSWLTEVVTRGDNAGLLTLQATPLQEARILMTVVHGALISARAARNPDLYGEIVMPALERLLVKAPVTRH
ncbi:TetR family transcriptional regulator [Thalassospira marina]|uniref:TetR family transcriptional regulator n=2 Tax=Thalassospira marina TaxID=2048283 RepID=A0A2N3KRG5_9PROT|nr:TetR family transcriptional regulator [Thalassospira marina]